MTKSVSQSKYKSYYSCLIFILSKDVGITNLVIC